MDNAKFDGIDGRAMLDAIANMAINKVAMRDKRMISLAKLLNKYGISGMELIAFMSEFIAILPQITDNPEEE